MNFVITARKFTASQDLKDKIEKKLSKFDKFFDGEADAKVVMSIEKDRHNMEVTLEYKKMIFRAAHSADDFLPALELCVDSLERSMRKNKTKLEKRLKAGAYESYSDSHAETSYEVIRQKKFAVKPMDVDEAILQMELVGHNFFVYRDVASDEINVVYKRHDGGYGQIIPE